MMLMVDLIDGMATMMMKKSQGAWGFLFLALAGIVAIDVRGGILSLDSTPLRTNKPRRSPYGVGILTKIVAV